MRTKLLLALLVCAFIASAEIPPVPGTAPAISPASGYKSDTFQIDASPYSDPYNYEYIWRDQNGNTLAGAGPSFDCSAEPLCNAGDTLRATVRACDPAVPDDCSAESLQGTAQVIETPVEQPVAPTVSPSGGPKGTTFQIDAAPYNDPALTYTYRWSDETGDLQEGASPDFDCSANADCTAGDLLEARVTACDAAMPGICSEESLPGGAAVLYEIPAVPSINPAAGTKNSVFTINLASYPGPQIYYFMWTDDDGEQLQYGTQNTLDCSANPNCDIGDTIYAKAKACDPVHTSLCSAYSAEGSASVQNIKPEKPATPELSPAEPKRLDSITSSQGSATDPDHGPDPLIYFYDWDIGGTAVRTTSNSIACKDYDTCLKNKVVSVRVVAYDGLEYSDPSDPASVTVVNSPPTGAFQLSLDPIPAYKPDTLRAEGEEVTDPDPGESFTYNFNWSFNNKPDPFRITSNSPQPEDSLDCYSADQCQAGRMMQVSASACDSSGACTPVAKQSVLIGYEWMPLSAVGLMISLLVVSLVYMIGSGFKLEAFKELAKDELYQITVTALLCVLISGALYATNNTLLDALRAAVGGPEGKTLQAAALDYTGTQISLLESFSTNTRILINKVGLESSRSVYCSSLGVGFSLVNCGSINSVRSPLSQAQTALLLGIADMQAQKTIMTAFNSLIFLFLPLGVFMRSFRYTRAAGGAIMAVCIGFFIVFPAMVLLNGTIINTALDSGDFSSIKANAKDAKYIENQATWFDSNECDPYDPDFEYTQKIVTELNADEFVQPMLFNVIIRSLFMTALNLLVTLTAVRWMASILGSEIDVSSLARLS